MSETVDFWRKRLGGDSGSPSEEELLRFQLTEASTVLGVFFYSASNVVGKRSTKATFAQNAFRALHRAISAGCFDQLTTSPRSSDPKAVRELRQRNAVATLRLAQVSDAAAQYLAGEIDRTEFAGAVLAVKESAVTEGIFTPWPGEGEDLDS